MNTHVENETFANNTCRRVNTKLKQSTEETRVKQKHLQTIDRNRRKMKNLIFYNNFQTFPEKRFFAKQNTNIIS